MFLVSGPASCICSFQTQEGWQKQRKTRKLHWGVIGHPVPVKISCTFSWRRCIIKGSAEVRSHGLFIMALKKKDCMNLHISLPHAYMWTLDYLFFCCFILVKYSLYCHSFQLFWCSNGIWRPPRCKNVASLTTCVFSELLFLRETQHLVPLILWTYIK